MKSQIVAPSLLASDFGHLAAEVHSAEAAGADWLHLDVMDGHFVDNISFGPAFVQAVKNAATLPLDVHLMIENPTHYLPRFTPLAASVTVHVEAVTHLSETLQSIRAAGCLAGLAISPPTPFERVEPWLDQIDLLLVMTVNPGFGGQPFLPETLEKIRRAAVWRMERKLDFHIEVDGGIYADSADLCREAGANVYVAGTSVFGAADRAAAIRAIRGDSTN